MNLRIRIPLLISALCLSICVNSQSKFAAPNPILSPTTFIPDGEPHIFEYNGEKRVFLYGSRDERITGYCGYGHDVWSAPVKDLSKWTNHGEIFNVKQVQDIGYGIVDEQHFGAPDCVYNPVTKKYYLYAFLGAGYKLDDEMKKAGAVPGFGSFGPKCVVSESDSPAGPFVNPKMCDWPALNGAGTFDPAVLVDEQKDGSVRVYAYWGMSGGDRCAELDPIDMHTIINSETRKPDRDAWRKTLPEKEDNNGSTLFEASSIRKVGKDKYVFIYSAGERPSALTYSYGNSPMGPWKYGGRIIDNGINWRGGNDHGSIACINGQWYVFYHRHTAHGINRQAMMQPIELSVEGDKVNIPTVEMTSQASNYNGLNPFLRYNIGVCCYRKGNCSISGAPRIADGLQSLIDVFNGDMVGVKYFNFGKKGIENKDAVELRLNLCLQQNASLSLLCSSSDEDHLIEIGRFNLADFTEIDGKYHELILPLQNLNANFELQKGGGLKGKQAIYFRFDAPTKGSLCNIKEFEFAKKGQPTPNPLMDIHIAERATGGKVVAIPSRARVGESVKLVVYPENGMDVKTILVEDSKRKKVKATRNAIVPHGPLSYHFQMPATAVIVDVEFNADLK